MKILYSWLKDHLCFDTAPEVLAVALTRSGVETSVEDPYLWGKDFSIVKVQTLEPHPKRDTLKICKVVDVSGKIFQVVCGALNVKEGMETILARPGAFLPGSKKPLEATVFQGTASEGMLCSPQELAMTDVWKHDGIVDLEGCFSVYGTLDRLLPSLLGEDALLSLEVTANRGDLCSHLGVARELYALGYGSIQDPKAWETISPFASSLQRNPINTSLECKVTTSLCQGIAFYLLDGVNQGKTPCKMVRRLSITGTSLHFPAVDMTNYFLFDVGRPLHVFDMDAIQGPIEVRLSKEGESFLGLNDIEYALPSGLIVIADIVGILSLAGVMGGKRASCKKETKHMLLEAGSFHPSTIAKAGQATHIQSTARHQFERGVDDARLPYYLEKARNWLEEVCKATTVQHIQIGSTPTPKPIMVSLKQSEKLIGVVLSVEEAAKRLRCLGAKVEILEEHLLQVTPPSWRNDWMLPEDCIAELFRLNGYDEVSCKELPQSSIPLSKGLSTNYFIGETYPRKDVQRFLWQVPRFLVSQGLQQVITFSFVSPQQGERFAEEKMDPALSLINPISKELSVMRPSLLPHLLENYRYHKHHNIPFQPVFEQGPVFFYEEGKGYGQQERIGCVFPLQPKKHWNYGSHGWDFFSVKGCLQRLLKVLSLETAEFIAPGPAWCHPTQSATLLQNGKKVGYLGVLHPQYTLPVVVAELFLEDFNLQERPPCKLTALQSVEKDLSFFVPMDAPVGLWIKDLEKLPLPYLRQIIVIDHIQDMENNRRSVTLRAVLQSEGAQFSSKELREQMECLSKAMTEKGGILRGFLEA